MQTLQKRKYLCPTDYDEQYFDWHCLPNQQPPSDGSYWYTACGVSLPNRAEYISLVTIIGILGAVVFWNLHFNSSGDEVFKHKSYLKPKESRHKKAKRA